jgi:peroxisome-assembly ATPase
MSRSSRYATEQWLPLADSQRRWEKLALSVPPPTPSYLREARERVATTAKFPQERLRQTLGRPDETSSDFADEAGYSRSVIAGDKPRCPPVISESHVWGVREEWGPKAGEWGKGVKGSKSGKDGQ